MDNIRIDMEDTDERIKELQRRIEYLEDSKDMNSRFKLVEYRKEIEKLLKVSFYENKLKDANDRLKFLFDRGSNDETVVTEKRKCEEQLRKIKGNNNQNVKQW